MKKQKRIFSLVLVLCMLCSMFSFTALADETETVEKTTVDITMDSPYIMVNIADQFDTSVIGKVGETYADNWVTGSSEKVGHNGSDGWGLDCNVGTDGIFTGSFTKTVEDDTTITNYNYAPTYKLDRSTWTSAANDAIYLGNATSIKLSGRPLDRVSVIIYTGYEKGTSYLNLAVKSKNSDDITREKISIGWHQATSGDNNYMIWKATNNDYRWRQLIAPSDKTFATENDTLVTLETRGDYTSGTSQAKLTEWGIDLDGTEIPETLDLSLTTGSLTARTAVYALAVTEIGVSTDVLKAGIAAAEGIEADTMTAAQAETVNLANRYADEMILRGLAVESDYTALRALAEPAEWYAQDATDVPFIPMDVPYNADIIGKTGQTAGENWGYSANVNNARFGLSGDAERVLAKNISDNTISINAGGHDADKGEVIEGDTYYKYRINSSSLSVGDNDALSVSTTTATINASGRPIEKIALLKYAFLNPGGVPVDYTVNYTDGTSVTTTSKEYWASSELNYVNWYGTVADGIDWNRDSQYLLPNANTCVLEAYTKNSSNYDSSIHEASGGMKAYQILYLPVDKTKTVKNITVKEQYTNGRVYFLAATEIPVATADLQAKVDEVNAIAVSDVSRENSANIILANRYADELYARYITHESEFAHLRELKEAAEWYNSYEEPESYKVDISDYMDTDLIGKAGDTVTDVESFNTAVVKNAYYHDYRGATETFVYDEATDSGVYSVYERTPGGEYWTSAYETASDKTVPIYMEGLKTNANDAVRITPQYMPEFALTGRPSKELRFAMASETTSNMLATITYSDGTTSTPEELYVAHTSLIAWGSGAEDGKKDDNICGWFSFAGNPENPTGDRGYILTLDGENKLSLTNKASRSAEAGTIGLYKISVDPAKIPVSVKLSYVEGANMNPVNLWGITEIPTSSADIESYITSYQNASPSYVDTSAQSDEAKKMMWYANELEERNYQYASNYKTVVKNYNQAVAQDEVYVDIASQHTLDADLFVGLGDTPVGTPTRENLLYRGDGNVISKDGIITMGAPSNDIFVSPLTGVSFKLAGNYKNAGYDSVRMNIGASDKSFKLSEKQLKTVGFIVSADIASEKSDYIDAYLTYTDGSVNKQEIKVYGPNNTLGLDSNAHLTISTAAKYDADTNTYVSGAANDIAAMKVIPGYINADPTKKVASITFEGTDDFSYSVVAVTEVPYKNNEVYTKYRSLSSYKVDEIDETNAAEIIDICSFVKEAYLREMISETVCNTLITRYYDPAYEILSSVLSFTTSVSVDESYATATATMTNTTSKPQTYQIIIVAYDEDDRLLGINFSEEKTLASDSENITDSIKLEIISGATYKAFVWSGFGEMIPLSK